MSETNNESFEHRIHCLFCKTLLHSCNDEDCKEIKRPKNPPETKEFVNGSISLLNDGVCTSEICLIKFQAHTWQLAFEKCKENLEESKRINSTFRIFGMSFDSLLDLFKNGKIDLDITPREYLNSRTLGWEKLGETAEGIETLQIVNQLHELAMRRTSEIILKSGSKLQIKKQVSETSKKKILNKESENKSGSISKPKISKYDKMVNSHMSKYGIQKDEAKSFLAKMGITPESMEG